ncbi:MAG TPA: type I-D CRISPR-associated protein Cas10d/Csc3 [Chloroflexi bacterium]|nr:type I-D CRISPR-associated protein Cas10d/Csc3 [Chloroflexota bacterium]
MSDLDLQHIALLIGKQEPSVFKAYLDQVAHRGLTCYKAILQWGSKGGESLYTHVLNGIFVLETLRQLLGLSDTEARVLYTAVTVHDINKVPGQQGAFGKLATCENLAAEIERLGMQDFIPDWREYLEDVTSLVRGHSGHHHSGGERWNAKRESVYGLGLERVNALLHLVRAADVADLSHTLEDSKFKADFLGHLNAYLADSGRPVQYEFFTHRLTEQRGILTNVIHNAIAAELRERYGLIPLLYYPDGIAYLAEKGCTPVIGDEDLSRIAERIARTISRVVAGKYREFITPAPTGIKVDEKCLELQVPFKDILREIYNIIQRRTPDPAELDAKARDWAQRGFEKAQATYPEIAEQVQIALDDTQLLVSQDVDRLRQTELIRSYYIFLNKHFQDAVDDPWTRIYELLELPEAQYPFYAYFDALWARAYVLSRDLTLSEEEIYQHIEADGAALIQESEQTADPKESLFADYLSLYAVFSAGGQPAMRFDEHLAHYVEQQHKQCVYCSGPFPTDKWMTADVRSDITVQVFSNRLRGGPGEPKKYICAICQIQFLLEKLDYPEVRGEKTFYLHLFPYSFLTGPFIEGLNATIRRIINEDTAVQALNMRAAEGIQAYLADKVVTPTFRSRTKKDKPQPFGIYLPRYAETVGNLLIFPINPGGRNDTERFLFALWNALLLQRHFGVKVLLSNAPVPPLGKDDIPDLYVDNVPLACEGLLPRNDYAQFENGMDRPGRLPALWDEAGHLFELRQLTFTSEDNTPRLVRALVGNPMTIFYETEKLLEARVRGQEAGGLLTWLSQEAFPHVNALALNKGGQFMAQLSTELQRLAEIAWQDRLRGRSLEKSALLYPVSEVLTKLGHAGGHIDREALKAAAVQDIFDHLYRIADDRYKPGKTKWEVIKRFVDIWFDDVLEGVYGGSLRKLLADEKLIRSAFLFYVREQIPRKKDEDQGVEIEQVEEFELE